MKIQFFSDLHLEFAENCAYLEKQPLAVTGDILLIAGDTAYLDLPDSGVDTYSRYAFWDWRMAAAPSPSTDPKFP